jgi:hypothetical protein
MALIQGVVEVDVVFGSDGKVLNATATGKQVLLNKYAESSVREWVFGCLKRECTSEEKARVVFEYKIEGEPVEYKPCPRVIATQHPARVLIVTKPSVASE